MNITTPVKRLPFDLDKNPADRWTDIIEIYKDKIPRMKEEVNKIFKELGLTGLIRKALDWFIYFYSNNIMHQEEISSIAKATGLDFEQVLLMQLMYEMNAACTTLITNVNDKPVMFRTMDWDLSFLKELTVELSVLRNGQEIAVVPTWVGCVGFFTAYIKGKDENYAIALNYRRTFQSSEGGLLAILKNAVRILRLIWPCSYLIRYICESHASFDNAKWILSSFRLISPCYLTLFHPTKSCIITRDADEAVNIRQEPLYQTNIDAENYGNPNTDNIIWSRQRETILRNLIKDKGNKFNSVKELLDALNQRPIYNIETIYRCVIDETEIVTDIA
jgi:beta subunit of N-acylethanolamine-hydrolyzing acid amidase